MRLKTHEKKTVCATDLKWLSILIYLKLIYNKIWIGIMYICEYFRM